MHHLKIFFSLIIQRRRPKGGHGVEKNVGLYNKKDARQDTMSSASHSTRSGKDLKSKSIAAALERVFI
jgi:hypothetical protein